MMSPRLIAPLAAFALLTAIEARAQSLEISPFGGYRFGGDLFEFAAGHPIDQDGARAFGLTLDIPLSDGMHVEGLFSHQRAGAFTVDHWQAGGLQELSYGSEKVRPFLTGVLGLTRYAVDSESEIRFGAGAGGGVKLFPVPHIGFRLDGRLFATLVDGDVRSLACRPGACFYALHLNLAWQAEFSAGLIVKLR